MMLACVGLRGPRPPTPSSTPLLGLLGPRPGKGLGFPPPPLQVPIDSIGLSGPAMCQVPGLLTFPAFWWSPCYYKGWAPTGGIKRVFFYNGFHPERWGVGRGNVESWLEYSNWLLALLPSPAYTSSHPHMFTSGWIHHFWKLFIPIPKHHLP